MATYNFMNEQVTTDASGTPTTVAPITSSTTNTSGALSNVQTGESKPISMAQMYPAQPITVPTAPATPNPAEATVASASETTKTLDQYIKEMTPQKTETSQQYDSILGELNNLLPGLTGRGSDQLAAETQAGLPDLKQKLAGLNAQILSKVAELTKSNASYEQLIANLENPANAQQQGIPMSAIIGQQAQARKAQLAEANSKSADLGLLQAVASGMQGNIQAMQQGIDRAIDLKYQDRESTVNLKMQQLQLLEGKLNKEEAIQKAALERKYNEEREKLAEEKAKAKENINLAFEANVQTKFVNKGGEFFRVSDGKPYGDINSFFADAGVKSFDEAYQRGLVTDVDRQRLEDIDFASQARAKYWDAGIKVGDTMSTIAQKIKNSGIWQSEQVTASDEGFTLSPGEVRYDSAGNIVASGGAPLPKPLTEAQAKDVTYAQRTEESNTYINQLEKDIAKYNPLAYKAQSLAEGNVLLNGTVDDKIRQSRQAERNFGTAVLRRESGAAISPSEFATMEKQYFPRPGDDEQTLRQKAQNRQTAITNFKASNPNPTGTQPLQWQDPATGDTYQFPDQDSLNRFKQDNGISFNSVGKTSASNITPVIAKAYPPGSVGGQCGDFVRKVVSKLGGSYPSLGNSLTSKINAVKNFGTSVANAKVGSVIVTKENPTYGHVAYIIGKNANGWIVGESNFKQSNKVSYGRTIPFNSPLVIGVINPTKTA
jgi:surface antigen